MKKTFAVLVALTVQQFYVGGQTLTPLVVSDFDSPGNGADGWSGTNNANAVNAQQYQTFFSANGNPFGYIRVGETAGGDGTTYLVAPQKFLGDQRRVYNGVLRFDLKQSAANFSASWYQDNDVVIASSNVVLNFRFFPFSSPTTNSTLTNWSTFLIPLNENSGWILGGSNRLATHDEFLSALQSIQRLWIRAEYTSHNADYSDLDNVMLLGQSSGPIEPSLAVQSYAGISINGSIGRSYRIEYVSALENTNSWHALTNVALPESPYLFIDRTSPMATTRIYRAVLSD